MDRRVSNRQPVLATTDMSAAGAEAVRQAHEWARAEQRPLCVMLERPRPAAITPLQPHRAAPPMVDADESVREKRALDRHVREVTGRSPSEYELALSVDDETEHPSASDVAADIEAAAIVVGYSGKQDASRAVLGSFVELLIEEAPCPVFVASPWMNGGPIVALVRADGESEPVLETAASVAERMERKLVILVAEEGALPGVVHDLDTREREQERARRELADTAERALASLGDRDLEIQARFGLGDPLSLLREVGEELKAAVLVVGARRPRTEDMAREMLEQAPECSVLVA